MTTYKTIDFAVDMADGDQYDAVARVAFEAEGRRLRVLYVDSVNVVRENGDGVMVDVRYDGPGDLMALALRAADDWLEDRAAQDAARDEAAAGERVDRMLDECGGRW